MVNNIKYVLLSKIWPTSHIVTCHICVALHMCGMPLFLNIETMGIMTFFNLPLPTPAKQSMR
jgi:hypothetical protein